MGKLKLKNKNNKKPEYPIRKQKTFKDCFDEFFNNMHSILELLIK